MRYPEFQAYAARVRTIADRAHRLIDREARITAQRAGLDPQIAYLHAHNALCGLEYGKPWPEVDYSLARRVLWLERKAWEPSRLADSIVRRALTRIVW